MGGAGIKKDGNGRVVCTFQVRCRICAQASCMPSSTLEIPADTSGFFMESCNVIYQGICPQCQKNFQEMTEK